MSCTRWAKRPQIGEREGAKKVQTEEAKKDLGVAKKKTPREL